MAHTTKKQTGLSAAHNRVPAFDGGAAAVNTLLAMEAATRPGWGWCQTDSQKVLYRAIRQLSSWSAGDQKRFAEVLNGYLGATISGAGEPNLAYYIRKYVPNGEAMAVQWEAAERRELAVADE